MRIQNTCRPLDDEPVQFLRSDGFAESFSEPMQEIENEGLFDLNFLMGAFQCSNPLPLVVGGKDPPGHRRQKQSEKKSRPHHAGASLLRRRLVMKVLF